MTQLIQTLRWIAILPASILAGVVAQVLPVIGGIFVPDWIAQASSSWIVPAAFVIGGVYTAPKFKFVVALILTVLVASLEFLMGFLVLTDAMQPPSGISKWWFIVNAVVGIAAPIYICASLHHDPDSLLSETN
jgi:hypothetical protein